MSANSADNRPALDWWISANALATILLLLTAGAGWSRSLDEIRSSGELRVCLTPIHPSISVAEPSGCGDNCQFSGPAVDLVRAFAETQINGVQLVFRKIGWDEQFHNVSGVTVREDSYTPALLADGDCDLFPNHMTVTDWRLRKLDIVPLVQNRMMVMVNINQVDAFKDAGDLAGKSTSVEENTSFHGWLQAQNMQAYADNPVKIGLAPASETYPALDAGDIDFAIADANSALWMIRHQLQNTAVTFPVGDIQQIGWAVRKDDLELKATIEAFFQEQKAAQATILNQIWERHFGVTLYRFETLVKALK